MQIVAYTPRADEPATLSIADDGSVHTEVLEPGKDISHTLGERRCAGTVDGAVHRPCDAERAPFCEVHADRWACARCTGGCDLPLESCREEHAVYLAAFRPDAFKVGVTRSWRLETRLREQGADAAAHLRTVADGRIAREIEAEIAASVGDRVRVRTKIDGLAEPLARDAWESLLAEFEPRERYEFDYGIDLGSRPMAETIASGTVAGVKGRIVLLQNGASTCAVDLRDLVGYDVTEGGSDRNLQSSLGAFE